MIRESIVTTQAPDGTVHIAPMGVHVTGNELLVMPFRPSTTLENLLATKNAAINYTDDVRIFAGCLTGRKNWPVCETTTFIGSRLVNALAHSEIEVSRVEQDKLRPKLYCKILDEFNHKPFHGFNRAQSAVLEAAILVSRLQLLPAEKIASEIEYLTIGMEKTAGENEREAWGWLMEKITEFNRNRASPN